MSPFVQSLSRSLFWDVDPETVDDEKYRRFIIQRVLERGTFDELKRLIAHYTMPVVISEAQRIRALDPITLAFASCLGNVEEETFRCFATQQLSTQPWNC